MALSLQFYINYTSEKIKMQRKSQASVDCGHILKFIFDPDCLHVEAVVHASMRDTSYKVTVSS